MTNSCRFLTIVFVLSCGCLWAAPTIPSLPPGSQFRIAFVTSDVIDATSSNITTYNEFVTNVAHSQPILMTLETTWSAIASTPTVNAIENTNTHGVGVPIFLLNDRMTKLADDYLDLWDGEIDNPPLEFTESGDYLFRTFVWTGTQSNGQAVPDRQLGTAGPIVGYNGFGGLLGPGWIEEQPTASPRAHLPIYALSGILTAAPNSLNSIIGDANLDGNFTSSDLVHVFQAGEFEDGLTGNSDWSDGDWNGDGEFDTSDLVLAFQEGKFEQSPGVAAVPEPSMSLGLSFAVFSLISLARRQKHFLINLQSLPKSTRHH